jgi:RNA-directed DNA polymerase
MGQHELFDLTENLFSRLCTKETLYAGFMAVKANDGSPGIDGVTIADFEQTIREELTRLEAELTSWSYVPKPVRRVEIPKPNGGVRLLGVPCIRDRVVQAALKLLLEPVFDPGFSEHSYGFRPGKNQKQAVESARRFVASGKEHVVDIDLSKFFDRINHDRLLHQIKKKIPDAKILKLIALTLRSGVANGASIERTTEGTTQGSPLSPLLSNIVLDELDKELERRGLSFCRYADDCNIFVGSKKAAERIMESITELLEKKMKLVVNREKSKVCLSSASKFLGLTIVLGLVTISAQAMDRGMEKIKELTHRRSHQRIELVIEKFNRWYRGWSSYFEMTSYPGQFARLEAHFRRRVRCRMAHDMKRRRTIARRIVKSGQSTMTARRVVDSHKSWWALSKDRAFEVMFPNRWFIEQGMLIKSTETHSHWLPVKERVCIP